MELDPFCIQCDVPHVDGMLHVDGCTTCRMLHLMVCYADCIHTPARCEGGVATWFACVWERVAAYVRPATYFVRPATHCQMSDETSALQERPYRNLPCTLAVLVFAKETGHSLSCGTLSVAVAVGA